MKFLAPLWLWFLAAVPLVFAALYHHEKRRQARFARFARQPLWATLAPELDPRARLRKAILWTLAMQFGILALARPQWGTREEVLHITGLDVMIALDVSNSMEAEDVIPSRLKKAKHEIRGLLDRLQGDRVGLVSFAANGYLACPLTTDLEYLFETVQLAVAQAGDLTGDRHLGGPCGRGPCAGSRRGDRRQSGLGPRPGPVRRDAADARGGPVHRRRGP